MKVFLFFFFLCMKTFLANSFNTKNIPKHVSSVLKNNIRDVTKASIAVGVAQVSAMSAASAANNIAEVGPRNNIPDTSDHFTTIGNNMPVCRLLNGMWQVSGAHGFEPNKDKAVSDMARYAGMYSSMSYDDVILLLLLLLLLLHHILHINRRRIFYF